MENVVFIFNYVNDKMAESAKKPAWGRSEKEANALRYAMSYQQNENWLNSVEALFHRYGINEIPNNMEMN